MKHEPVRKDEYITCAAIHYKIETQAPHQPRNIDKGVVLCGHRHHNIFAQSYAFGLPEALKTVPNTQGFVTSFDRFVDRKEAAEIAYKVGQLEEERDRLFSEDIY